MNLPADMLSYLKAVLAYLHLFRVRHGLCNVFGDLSALIETVRLSKIKANNSIFQTILAFHANYDNARMAGNQFRQVLLKLLHEQREATRRVKERNVTILTCTPENEFTSFLAEAELNA